MIEFGWKDPGIAESGKTKQIARWTEGLGAIRRGLLPGDARCRDEVAARPAFDTVGARTRPEQAVVKGRELDFRDAPAVVDLSEDEQRLERGQSHRARPGQLKAAFQDCRVTSELL